MGKSTLLNCLLGTSRAIVTEEPGTTRDTIEEEFILEGLPLRLVDTAGLRESENIVEREGILRARALIKKADLNVLMYDCSVDPDTDDMSHLKAIDPEECVIVLNKSDLGIKIEAKDFAGFSVVSCCLLKRTGIAEIKSVIAEKLGIKDFTRQ